MVVALGDKIDEGIEQRGDQFIKRIGDCSAECIVCHTLVFQR